MSKREENLKEGTEEMWLTAWTWLYFLSIWINLGKLISVLNDKNVADT